MIHDIIKTLSNQWYFQHHDRSKGMEMEIEFWDNWLKTAGGNWSPDFNRRISPTTPVQWPHDDIIKRLQRPAVSVLDVGSGPMTKIGYVLNGVNLTITACDPNAASYNALLKKHNISPPVTTTFAEGEKLSETLNGPFDYITCINALDHSENPDACLKEMLKLVAHDGVIFLMHNLNEAVHEGYRGYHKWNIHGAGADAFEIWNMKVTNRYSKSELGRNVAVSERNGKVLILIADNPNAQSWIETLSLPRA
jgi:2-polyprenyl-3-methyl-5-hydroxy-6-metoxy-1,4-benzoquinol methylase